jgi:hypothetical protein
VDYTPVGKHTADFFEGEWRREWAKYLITTENTESTKVFSVFPVRSVVKMARQAHTIIHSL